MRPATRSSETPANMTIREAITATVYESRNAQGERIPPKAIAQDMNVELSRLYDVADDQRPGRLKAEEIPALIRSTGNYLLLDVIERAVGRVGVSLPTNEDKTVAEVATALKEFGEFVAVIGAASSHGFTRLEASRIRIEGEQAIAIIAALIRQAEANVTAPQIRAVR